MKKKDFFSSNIQAIFRLQAGQLDILLPKSVPEPPKIDPETHLEAPRKLPGGDKLSAQKPLAKPPII